MGIRKRAFSQHELSVATATGHLRFLDRHTRLKIRGYPIDDIDPTRATDRDDAVFAEKTPWGYTLHVTIADVGNDTLVSIGATDSIRLVGVADATTVTVADFNLAG